MIEHKSHSFDITAQIMRIAGGNKEPSENAKEIQDIKPAAKLVAKAAQKKEEREIADKYRREIIENIKTSERLRIELLKGVRTGKPIEGLFLKAIECISLMTSEKGFYTQIYGDITNKREKPHAAWRKGTSTA